MIPYKVRPRKNPVSQEVKYYAASAETTPMTRDLCIEQIEKICAMTSADVKAVLDALQYVIETSCKNGISVRLGDLGSFRPVIVSDPSDKAADVKAENIKRVRVRYVPSGTLVRKMAVSNCTFRQVTTGTDGN